MVDQATEYMAGYDYSDELLKLCSQWENIGKVEHLKKNECPLDMPVCVRSICPFFGEIGSDMSKEGPKAQLGCKKHFLDKYINDYSKLYNNLGVIDNTGKNAARDQIRKKLKEYINI